MDKKKQDQVTKYVGIAIVIFTVLYLSLPSESFKPQYTTQANTLERQIEEKIIGFVKRKSLEQNRIIEIQSTEQVAGKYVGKVLLKIVYRAPIAMKASVINDATQILLKLSKLPISKKVGEVMLMPHLNDQSGKDLQVGKIVIELKEMNSIQRNQMVTEDLERFYSNKGEFKVWGI